MAQAVNSTNQRPRQSREEVRAQIVEATTELVRERSFAELTVGEIMDRAGLERTIFYRHFENIGGVLLGAGREAVDELYAAQLALAGSDAGSENASDVVRQAVELAVAVYHRHGPLLRAVSEAVAANQLVAVDQDAIRRRFDELTAKALLSVAGEGNGRFADVAETSRALNSLNESYLLDAFGREPRLSVEDATRTLSEIWAAVIEP